MRFMYETVAETAGHISFDSVDPFYDSLPWFRLIGRYVSTLNIEADHDLSLFFPHPFVLCCSISISRQAHVPFSPPLVLLHFIPPPLLFLHFPILYTFVAFSRNFSFSRALPHSVSSSCLHWSLFSLLIAFFPCDLHRLCVFASTSSSSVILVLFFFSIFFFFLRVSLIDNQNEIISCCQFSLINS